MNLVPWHRDFSDIERYMNHFFEGFPFGFSPTRQPSPKVDVYQNDKAVIMKAEIPGVAKEDLNVFVDENSVRLSGQVKKQEEFNENNVYRSERYYGSFSRTIPLPAEVKSADAKAVYKDGILTLTVPKEERGKAMGYNVEIQ
jgi:HSP20 family protein